MPDKIFPQGRGALFFAVLLADTLLIPAGSGLNALWAGLLLLLPVLIWLTAAKRWGFSDGWTLLSRCTVLPRRALALLILLFALVDAVRTARDSAAFLYRTALSAWPVWAGTAVLLIVCWLVARQGICALCLWSIPVSWIAGGIIVLSLLLSAPDWQWERALLAVSADGVLRIVGAFLPPVLLLLLFTGHDPHLPQGRASAAGIAGAAVLCGLSVMRTGAVLGIGTVRVTHDPVYLAAGAFDTGVLAHSEVIFGTAFFLCMLARIALALCVIRQAWQVLSKAVADPVG